MPSIHRLTGRFFSILISVVLVLLTPRMTMAQGPTLCQITDTVYRADGTPAQGDVVIVWPAFTTAAGQPVAAGNLTVTLGAQGQFSAALAPNAGAMPAGTYYRVTYKLDDGTNATEFWTVPNLPTTTIGAIRSTLAPANLAAQYLTRAWADAHYVDLTDAQTVNGVKTFSSSPQVPTPQNPNDAANKAYVDANSGGGGGGNNLSSPPPIGNVTPNSGNFTTLTVQSTNGIPTPTNSPATDPCAQINAAIGALPPAGGTVDARGFAPGETCNTVLQINKPVTLQLGAGEWVLNGSPGINVSAPNVVISCLAATSLENSATTLTSGAAAPLIANFADAEVNSGNYHTADGTQVLNCALNGNSVGTFGIFAPAVYSMKIHGVHASGFTGANILALAGQTDLYNTVSDTSGGDGVVWGADGHISGMSASNSNAGDGWHIVSGGNVLDAPAASQNKLYGLHVDGNEGGDWVASYPYLEPKIILPTSNNAGGYAYYTQQVGTTAATRPAQFCQSVGCTTRDGNVMWINVGNANLYGLGASEFYAKMETINSPNISQSNYGNNPGDWDNILVEGTAAMPATQITVMGAKAQGSAVPSYPTHGVHLKYVSNSSVKGIEWSGGALNPPQQPQAELGGMAVESSSMVELDDVNCNQSYGPCLSLLGSSDIVASKIVSLDGGAASGPAGNVATIDSNSHNILLDEVEADDNRSSILQCGIASSGSHIVVKNEKYGTVASGDSGVLTSESLAAATDSLLYNIPASGQYQWSVGGGAMATVSNVGLNVTTATAQDLSTANFPVMDVRNYGIKGDANQLYTCTGAAGSAAVPCSGVTFSNADVGKLVDFFGAGSSGNSLLTTIAGCSPSCPSNTAVLAASVVTNSTQTFFYGTDNTAAWCTMMNCNSATSGQGLYTPSPGRRIFVPRGTYFFSGPISTRNGDQLIGADQSATELALVSPVTNATLLYLGAYNNSGTWTTDAGGLNLGVRGILFANFNSAAQTCIETLQYSGWSVKDSWFECGIGIHSTGSSGRVEGNVFDANTWAPIQLDSYGANNYGQSMGQIQVTGNQFFGARLNAIGIDGGLGIVVADNDFWDAKISNLNIYSPTGLTTRDLTVTGNHFNQSPSGSYACTGSQNLAIGSPLQDATISGNTFTLGHEYDIAASAPLANVQITDNTFRGACLTGECTNPCSGQNPTSGQQLSAIDLESTTSSNVTIAHNSFDSPGLYAVRSIGPVNLEGNSCSNPFATSPSPGHSYDTGCFAFPSSSAAGSMVKDNVTTSTTAAAAVAWNGATGIRFSGNQSASSADVVVAGGSYSSWNERVVNAGGATIASQMDPTTGNANFAGSLSAQSISGHEYFVSHYASIQAAINAAAGSGQVTGAVVDDRTSAYTGPGFMVPDSVTVELAPVTYTINATVAFNNGNNNVTAGIILQPGARLLGASTSSNHGTVVEPANGLNADLIATSTVGTGTTNPQWWHWGEVGDLRLIGNGANQTAGDCLKIENLGETTRVHDLELSGCYANNMEFIGDSASQSAVSNITSGQATTGAGVAFTNLSGVAVLTGISGDCNQTALINANFNAAGTLNITGLKAEAENSICPAGVQDPVILTSETNSTVLGSVSLSGGYAFGTSQQNFLKNAGPGAIQFTEKNFYLTGYTNILDDTTRTTLITNNAQSIKQPVSYLSNGMIFGNQAFTFQPNTFMQASSNGTPTEIFGAGSDDSTDIAAMGNGDGTSYFNGGIKFGTFNTTMFGQTPGYQARMGWRWTNPTYDETTWTFIPIWAPGDNSARWIGDPNQRWPEVYASDVNATTATIGTLNVTTCNGCGGGGMVYPATGIASSTGSSWGASYNSTNPIPASIAPGAISSIALQNNGTLYGTLNGPGTLNFANCSVSGTSPNFTITCSGGSGMIYPGAGIASSTGSAWGTSYSTSNPVPATIAPGVVGAYPSAGIANSTGTAWGTSYGSTNPIPAGDVAAGYPYTSLSGAPSFASPPPIGSTTPNSGSFTSLNATGPITSTNTSGAEGIGGGFGPAPAGGANDLPACGAGVWNVWGGSDSSAIHWCANSTTVNTLTPAKHVLSGSMQGPTSAMSGTGSAATLYSYTIPAGTFSVGMGVKCYGRLRHTSGSATVTMYWKLGSTTYTYPTTFTTGNNGGEASIEIFTPSSVASEVVNVPWAAFGGTTESPYTGLAWSENLANADTIYLQFNVASTDQVKGDMFWCETIQ